LRQAYDYWQDQPGSPRRGKLCQTHKPHPPKRTRPPRRQRSPRPAFDTQPTLRQRPSLDTATAQTERTRRRCSSRSNRNSAEALQPWKLGQSTPANQTKAARRNARLPMRRLAANSPHPVPRDKAQEPHIERPLKREPPMLSHGDASARNSASSTRKRPEGALNRPKCTKPLEKRHRGR
jgi:hypothetical protein